MPGMEKVNLLKLSNARRSVAPKPCAAGCGHEKRA
jgi:hypothetical protein